MLARLQKILSASGVASRRASEQYILEGRVMVNGETVRALNTPDTRERLTTQGFDVIGSTPQALAEYIRTDIARFAKVIREGNIRVE